jgi:hypothetical protein
MCRERDVGKKKTKKKEAKMRRDAGIKKYVYSACARCLCLVLVGF